VHSNLFHLGHLHIPVFSAFAVVGLIAALILGQRTAPIVHVSKEDMWDAGITAAILAFVISRLLLIATNFKSFLSYPLLVLSLPSITVSGILLTAIILLFFLRTRNVSIGAIMDASAPCFALLWAILSLGSFATGSSGMPTDLPWGIEDSVLGRIHPVEVYISIAALVLCVILYHALHYSGYPGYFTGKTAATGLFLAGAISFFLDFLSQPADPTRIVLIDPVQWVGFAMLLFGFLLLLPQLVTTPDPQVDLDHESEESTPHAV